MKVNGMHCASCETLIRDALLELPGIKKVDISSKTGVLTVTGDKMDKKAIVSAITAEGYEVA